jgi:ribonuclease P protein subunit RPR2
MRFSRKHKKQQQLAKQHIAELFSEAKSANPTLAMRYVSLARRIGMKFRMKMTPQQKRQFCRSCNAFLTSRNSRTRLRKGMVVQYCMECRQHQRFRYK